MLKLHEIICPSITDSFYDQTVNLFQRKEAGHMGPQMYQHHEAMKGSIPMSGVITWAAHAKHGFLPAMNKKALDFGLPRIFSVVEPGTPIVEFGPGSMQDACSLIDGVQSTTYIPVDCSLGIIQEAKDLATKRPECTIVPSVLDFFSNKSCALIDRPSFGVLLGLTIDNLPGPAPRLPPKEALTNAFKNLMQTMPAGGKLLVSTDICQDGARNVAHYSEKWHRLFGVNHIFRMAKELPMKNFDPEGFEYVPVWHEECRLIAHTVQATKDMSFSIGQKNPTHLSIKAGDVFHYNNSFRYTELFFEACAAEAGMTVLEKLRPSDCTIVLYLLDIPEQVNTTSP